MTIDWEKCWAVRGRMLKVPTLKKTIYAGQVVLAIDDESNPEFWMTLTITEDGLKMLLDQIKEQREMLDFRM